MSFSVSPAGVSAVLVDTVVLSVEASDADSAVEVAVVPLLASAVPVAVASVPIEGFDLPVEVTLFLTEGAAQTVEAELPIVGALLPVEVAVFLTEGFVLSVEVIFVRHLVLSPSAEGVFVSVVEDAVSAHNMNRGEKYYDSAAIFHDIG